MAMEKPKEEPAAPVARKSKMPMLLMAVGAVVLAIVAGLVVFMVVLRPRLGGERAAGSKEGSKSELANAKSVTVPFDEAFSTVIMPSPDLPASTLLYKVTLECSDQATADKITNNKARFTAMVRQLHSYKNRKELDDPLVEQSICRQVQEEANKMLKQIPDPPEGEHKSGSDSRVTAVLHEKFFVQDM